MRKFTFNLIAKVFAFQIVMIQGVSTFLLQLTGNVGHFLMKLVDPKTLAVYEQLQEGFESDEPTELEKQNMELRLLASASQVRDHAASSDDWTDRHTEALNAIGDALIVEAGWEEESVHQYLKGLVESIDGLEYGTEDW